MSPKNLQASGFQSRRPTGKSGPQESAAPKTLPFLLEIGCEELPARFLADAQKRLGEQLRSHLAANRLLEDRNGCVETYSTPRRLVARVPQVLSRRADTVEVLTGPPLKAALDANGKYTRAAEAFAAKHGAPVSRLQRITTPKGEYVALEKRRTGEPAAQVLTKCLEALLWNFSFPKSMYWERTTGAKFTFLRPIRWIAALLGEGKEAQVIPFEIPGVRSGGMTFGHRAKGRRPIRLTGFEDYAKKLRAKCVEIDPARRRETVRKEIKALLEGEKLRAVADPWLEDWVVNSTEWPHPIAGEFDPKFLDLPREILITVMRDHQKYFAVEDAGGHLAPRFVAFLNRDGDPKGVIRAGHERVLRARFADARFFWAADQKVPLRDRLPLLKNVIYHEKLGSYADKVRRMQAIAESLGRLLESGGQFAQRETALARRAVELCKCDLTTQMVQEFTELQGVVGGLYAKAQGEPPEVAEAIYDHYLPQGAEDPCPRSVVGAVVSLADKLDAVISGFAAGLEPTGSSDPFALRRAGNGILRIAVEVLRSLDLLQLVETVVGAGLDVPADGDLTGAVSAFLRDRAEQYFMLRHGLRYDTVRAVLRSSESWSPPRQALERARQLQPFVQTEEFQALAAAAKRTRNILAKSAESKDFGEQTGIAESLLSAGPERELFAAYGRARKIIEAMGREGRYADAFKALAGLRPYIDRFFDKVLVMDNDLSLRANRLRLLRELDAMVFLRFADLSQIESGASTSVGAPTSKSSDA